MPRTPGFDGPAFEERESWSIPWSRVSVIGILGESDSPSCIEVSIVDRVELGVPALEEPLIGDSDLARSKFTLVRSLIIARR